MKKWFKRWGKSHPPHPPILPRSNPFCFLKNPGKIIGIVHAAFLADFFNGKVCEAEQLFGVGDADLDQVTVDGEAKLIFASIGVRPCVQLRVYSPVGGSLIR